MPFILLQSVFGYSYSSYPAHIQKQCTQDIGLLNAAECLYYRYHRQEWVRYIWAIGLLAAGQSSTMTVSVGHYQVCEGNYIPVVILGIRMRSVCKINKHCENYGVGLETSFQRSLYCLYQLFRPLVAVTPACLCAYIQSPWPAMHCTFLSIAMAHVIVRLHIACEIIAFSSMIHTYIHTHYL